MDNDIVRFQEVFSSRKEITRDLSSRLLQYTKAWKLPIYMAREVSLDVGTNHPVRIDFLGFRPQGSFVSSIEKGDFYCYEIKSSVEDFHSPHGHNFLGDYNCYVMPRDVFEKIGEEIPWKIGVLIPAEEKNSLHLIKKAKRSERTKSNAELLFAMLRSVLRDSRESLNASMGKDPDEPFL